MMANEYLLRLLAIRDELKPVPRRGALVAVSISISGYFHRSEYLL
jgi:hypothetical protein